MKKLIKSLFVVAIVFSFASCVKKDFDAPPAGGVDPDLTANITIAKLKSQYYKVGQVTTIGDDVIIEGIVIADDKSGNFYKTIVIQDSTGGISIRLDLSGFYATYPIGRRLFVKCKGLAMGDYGGLIQMGGYVDNTVFPPEAAPIPSTLVTQYFYPGVYNLTVKPKVLKMTDLADKYQNMLVELNDVEFVNADVNQPYADATNKLSVNRTVEDCSGNNVIVRTSGYANFASALTPSAKGTLVSVYTVFGSTQQLILRNTNDVVMDSTRCGGGSGGTTKLHTLDLRNAFIGGNSTVPSGYIEGICISDNGNGNIDTKNLVLQDSTGGIVVRFSAAHSFQVGDIVKVDVGGLSMSEFHGLLEITPVANANATKTGTGTITPNVATISTITTNAEAWESTLVQMNDISFPSTPGSYSGNVVITDPGNVTNLYTRTGASFATSPYPNTGTHSVTAIVYPYDALQVIIRSLADVQ